MVPKIKADYIQGMLLPIFIDDFISEDHPARFISEFVDELNLDEIGIKISKNAIGRPAYEESMLLKIWIYGYYKNIRSTRKLEVACKEQIPLLWISGMNYPDHSTLGNFSQENREVIKKLFKENVRLAMKANLVGLVLQALDGTKLQADVSKKKTFSRADVELVLEVLEEKVKDYGEEVDKNIDEEAWEYNIPKKLKKKESRKEWIEKEIEGLSEIKRLKTKDKLEKDLKELEEKETNYLNRTDIDSRMMKNGNKKEFCLNAQAVRDNKYGIITAIDITQEGSDNHELVTMLDQGKENTGKAADNNLVDGGYFSGKEIKEAIEKTYNVLMNIPKENKIKNQDRNNEFHQCNFSYNEEENYYICPRNGILEFKRRKKSKDKDYEVDLYHCTSYKTCPVRLECSKDKRGRSLEISPYKKYVDEQIKKQEDPANKALLKKRKEIIEPLFGDIKHNMGFRRWTWRGLENIKAQWSLICMTVNLKIMYKFWRIGQFNFV